MKSTGSSAIRLQLLETREASASWNMALDEALLDAAAAGAQPPCLRFYSWRPPAVTLGWSLDAAAEADIEACRAAGVPVVRRITGGGAVFHENELTYGIVLPVSAVAGPIEESYGLICGAIASGLNFLKKGFEFTPVNDIIYRSKKVSGSAQVRRSGWLLQHGTILLEPDAEKMFSLLRVPEGKYRKHGLGAARQRTGGLSGALGRKIGFDEAADAALRGLRTVFDTGADPQPIPWGIEEAARALEPKYRSDEWNLFRRGEQKNK
jgi:lipoate---protein ligase